MSDEIPGHVYMVADDLILVDGYRVDIGVGGKIGEHFGQDGPMYFLTFEGRLNNSQERRSVRLMMHAELGWEFQGEIIDRMEMFLKMAKERRDRTD